MMRIRQCLVLVLVVMATVVLIHLAACSPSGLSPDCPSGEELEIRKVEIATTPADVEQLVLGRPGFSPDGSLIACTLKENGSASLYMQLLLIEAPAMKPKIAADLPGAVEGWYGLSWRPDGRELAFTLIERSTGQFGIWSLEVNKNTFSTLCPGDSRLCQWPLYSPNGRSVLFRDAMNGNLVVCNLDTGTLEPLSDIGRTARIGYAWGTDENTVWASVGTKIGGGGGVLCRVSIVDHSRKRFNNIRGVTVLVPSPDGGILACLIESAEDQYQLGLFETSTGDYRMLAVANRRTLSWRADGKALAYEKGDRIWVYDFALEEHRAVTPAVVDAGDPFWHPKDNTLWCVTDYRAISRVMEDGLETAFSLDDTDFTSTLTD